MINSILCEVGSWLLVNEEFVDFSLNDFLKNWSLCITSYSCHVSSSYPSWVPPLRGKVKINFDGASFSNPRLVVNGCVVHD